MLTQTPVAGTVVTPSIVEVVARSGIPPIETTEGKLTKGRSCAECDPRFSGPEGRTGEESTSLLEVETGS